MLLSLSVFSFLVKSEQRGVFSAVFFLQVLRSDSGCGHYLIQVKKIAYYQSESFRNVKVPLNTGPVNVDPFTTYRNKYRTFKMLLNLMNIYTPSLSNA